jgi:hypothetical protein
MSQEIILSIKKDDVNKLVQSNLPTVRHFVSEFIEKYKCNVGETTIELKAEKAAINRLSLILDRTLIAFKNQLLMPYEDAKAEIQAMKNGLAEIAASRKKALEVKYEKQREIKRALIVEHFDKVYGQSERFRGFKLSVIFNLKWLNRRMSNVVIFKQIEIAALKWEQAVSKIRSNVNPIHLMSVLEVFEHTNYNAAKALKFSKQLEMQDRDIDNIQTQPYGEYIIKGCTSNWEEIRALIKEYGLQMISIEKD